MLQEGSKSWWHAVFSQGASSGGVKRAKVENWEKSVGTLRGRGALSSLVVRKKPTAMDKRPTAEEATVSPVSKAGTATTLQTGDDRLPALVKRVY